MFRFKSRNEEVKVLIFVTGLTGNTGQEFLKHCLNEEIVTVSRKIQNFPDTIICEKGDLTDAVFVESLFQRYQFKEIIHIANIRYTELIMSLAEKYHVPRVIAVHTTGIYSRYRSCNALYQEIETRLFNQTFEHTSYVILRPTMIYGNERDHNMQKLIRFLNKAPAFPVFGQGEALMQPVHVEDLGQAIYSVYQRPDIRNAHFDLSGGSVLTYGEIVRFITKQLGRNVFIVKIPYNMALFLIRLYNLTPKPIISTEQVLRLQEHKSYSHAKAKKEFNYNPRSIEKGLKEEVQLLRSKGII